MGTAYDSDLSTPAIRNFRLIRNSAHLVLHIIPFHQSTRVPVPSCDHFLHPPPLHGDQVQHVGVLKEGDPARHEDVGRVDDACAVTRGVVGKGGTWRDKVFSPFYFLKSIKKGNFTGTHYHNFLLWHIMRLKYPSLLPELAMPKIFQEQQRHLRSSLQPEKCRSISL